MINTQPIYPLPSLANKRLVRGGSTKWLENTVDDALMHAFFEPVSNPEYPEFLLLMAAVF